MSERATQVIPEVITSIQWPTLGDLPHRIAVSLNDTNSNDIRSYLMHQTRRTRAWVRHITLGNYRVYAFAKKEDAALFRIFFGCS
jgi:hypothetical protein